ncbi:hypothetical protein [Streptomyces sp. LaPpAH-108]|uniref:hypothetical protein n=1 Tax=Streptomyces sp. LaPpAH-108 TaxID=1155714 RepID=UPI00036C1D64|nr:hypothetical protein [Streptomyces sp. LaPpAH-108]
MTAGHKDHGDDGDREGTAAYGGGPDALMAAITGEEPSEEARRDARFRREHRAAEADVAVLRRELTRLAETLTGETGEGTPEAEAMEVAPARPPRPRPRRRVRTALLALAASAAVGLFGVGISWLGAHDAGGGASADSAASGAKLGPQAVIACARAVAEGTVERVEPAGAQGVFTVVLKVSRFYKPPTSDRAELTFTVHDTAAPRSYRTGARMLVVVPRSAAEDPQTFRAGDPPREEDGSRDDLEWGRAWVTGALPGARHLTCPGDG